MWFVCALLATIGWGIADLFYKKGSVADEKYSHLKICIFVGIFMGIQAIITWISSGVDYNFMNIIYYLPVTMMYFLSLVVVLWGLKYIEISIESPVENTYGAMAAILYFLVFREPMSIRSIVAIILITIGIILLGVFRASEESKTEVKVSKKITIIAFSMSVVYAILEAFGVLFDAILLDIDKTFFVGVTESNIEQLATISYGLTYLIIALILFIYIKLKHEKLDILHQPYKIGAGIVETLSQFVYYYALSGNGTIAGVITSSYCVVSILLARIFIKEKLTVKQYSSIAMVILGIILLSF